MRRRFRLDWALLPEGWARDVIVTVSPAGTIEAVAAAAAAGSADTDAERTDTDAERVAGYVVPGMPNAHSHAFQRALAGRAEARAAARDSFWTWRRAMYAIANQVDAADLRAIATLLFVEMLEAGYTSVAEFHYLHRTRDDESDFAPDATPATWEAIRSAARDAGIGLTLLPTLYQAADFGGVPLRPDQRRFQTTTAQFLDAIERRLAADRAADSPTLRTGAAFHSLRAVSIETIREATAQLRAQDPSLPIHIHVAEQGREVRACERATGARPIEWLLRAGVVDDRWCLVHCTHATRAELAAVAAVGATICVSISTEANLGDGFFDAVTFRGASGHLAIGSDSQSTVDPAEELRWLEYQQRLRRRRRNVLATTAEPHVGTGLWRAAAHAGARALGQAIGALAVGRRADWLALDPTHPALVGAAPAEALDHVVFAGGRHAIRDVYVAGRRVVAAHRHPLRAAAEERYREVMERLTAR
jgi:formimidoylglutamate deiminase